MKSSTKKLLIGTGIAAGAAGIFALYVKSAKYLMKVALDRQAPKAVERTKQRASNYVSEETSQLMTMLEEAANKLKHTDHEQVVIDSGQDGADLMGHWFPCENPKRIIVAMHGWRSGWYQDFGVIAPFWFRNDCAVLFAEQRAQGNSEGDYMGFGLLERFDCLDWIHWVNERTGGKLPVYLGGVSMGASTVLMTAGFQLPPNVRGIAADCGFTSPHAIWEYVAENNFHIPYEIYHLAAEDLCRKRIQVSADSYSTIEALQQATVPVLFVHGSDDHFVPIEMTYENYRACNSEKYLFVVPGAEHGMSYVVDREGYEKRVLAFWEKYDDPEAGKEKELLF